MNTRQKVLEEALKCVNGEREKQYGNPEDNFSSIADFWGLYLTTLFEDTGVVVELDPKDVAIMMILFKIARSLGDQDKLDNYVDMIGYAACGAEILERSEEDSKKVKEWVNKVDAADECKECDYAEKCMGTGVCLKETEKKWFNGCDAKKDRPDEKCNRKDCGQFDACMTAYQHYIYNKTKEASEAIDKCMCEQGKEKIEKGDSFWDTYQSISDHIISSSKANSVNHFDVVSWLTKNGHAPTEMASLLLVGRLNSDTVASYIEKAINEVKKEDKK